jgi:hypothetical protein
MKFCLHLIIKLTLLKQINTVTFAWSDLPCAFIFFPGERHYTRPKAAGEGGWVWQVSGHRQAPGAPDGPPLAWALWCFWLLHRSHRLQHSSRYIPGSATAEGKFWSTPPAHNDHDLVRSPMLPVFYKEACYLTPPRFRYCRVLPMGQNSAVLLHCHSYAAVGRCQDWEQMGEDRLPEVPSQSRMGKARAASQFLAWGGQMSSGCSICLGTS